MSKPSDKRLRQYPTLREIPADEWDDFFDRDGEEWTTLELKYLVEWLGKGTIIADRVENIVDLAYELGRTPYSIQDTIRRMRRDGWDVPYIRKEKSHGTERKADERDVSGISPVNDVSRSRSRRSEKHRESAREI